MSDKEIEIEWIYGTHPKIDTLEKQDFIRFIGLRLKNKLSFDFRNQ